MKTNNPNYWLLLAFLAPISLSAQPLERLTADNLATNNQHTVSVAVDNSQHIKICEYSERTICNLRIRERMPAIIRLPKDDQIQSWVLGDEENFSFNLMDNSSQKALLRGFSPSANTRLNIIGESGLIYSFYVQIAANDSQNLSDFVINLRLSHQDQETLYALSTAKCD